MLNKIESIKQHVKNAQNTLAGKEDIERVCIDVESLVAEVESLHKILHDLTPGGSEFYGDAERCAENIREQIEISQRTAKQTIRNSRIGWKPIEGAPKDRYDIIGVTKDGAAYNILWREDKWVDSLDSSLEILPTHYIEPPTQ